MGSAQDPRLVELRRLERALDIAAKHLDEFEARAVRSLQQMTVPTASARSEISDENSFAGHIVAGMAKFRQDR
jgi:hypothetical protein